MKLFSSKRSIAGLSAAVLLLLFLLRPGASRLKSRIISSISAGVGRPVDIGSVNIRILPWPGFDLQNLVVYDDPAFGAEPILRASEVTASLRLTSLIRGRLEIGRLDLNEPSLNLVHSQSGPWNLEALLERSSQIPLAPTAKARTEPRPGFPYIEASSGRINFKSGTEKKPYALTNADFSLWQESDNAWGLRLKAQPMRTDLGLNDTGMLQLVGTWQRAQSFRDTPLQLTAEWNHAQLGQVTKLLTGNDKGWRGDIRIDAVFTGTPAKLQISSSASVDDFRRFDIPRGGALRLAGQCDGQYSSLTHEFREVLCSAPVSDGLITLTGDLGLPGSHHYAVMVRTDNVPVSAMAVLAERAKKNLPDDLSAGGRVQGSFSLQEDAAAGLAPKFDGQGLISGLHLVSASNKAEFGPEDVPLALYGGTGRRPDAARKKRASPALQTPAAPHLEIGPVTENSGHAAQVSFRGWVSGSAFAFGVSGKCDLAQFLRQATMAGIPALAVNVDGAAQLDLQIGKAPANTGGGFSTGFPGAQVTGTAKLRNVQVSPRGTGGPIEITSADVQLSANEARIQRLNAKAAGSSWTGSLEMPRGCGLACPIRFALNANQIGIGELTQWVTPGPKKRPWYSVLQPGTPSRPSFLSSLHAAGQITTDHLQIHTLAATHVSAQLVLGNGKLELSELKADFLGGRYHGKWTADFSARAGVCTGEGAFSNISLAPLAAAMSDAWVAGNASASYQISGKCPAEFWSSAKGTVRVELTDATFPHLQLGEEFGPLRVLTLSLEAELHAGEVDIQSATLDSPAGSYEVTGTASLKRELELKLQRLQHGAPGYEITGTVSSPHVSPLPGVEQARLKPAPAK